MKKLSLLFAVLIITFSCSKDDDGVGGGGNSTPCFGVTCLNGGKCESGKCTCPPQWTGVDCGIQVNPKSIYITEVKVTNFPLTDNGAGWDLFDGPDIYFEIVTGTTTVYTTKNQKLTNLNNPPYTWTYPSGIPIDLYSFPHSIRLYDYDDTSADDYMGGIIFTPYSDTNKFPTLMKISCSGCNTEWEVKLSYSF